mmetsp:Transcript_17356/g.28867  ORF Transcript_17356/g.28867 Transcript_17356/m.28867 type:complete len:211 (-) Transcript_17356:20-652(-)
MQHNCSHIMEQAERQYRKTKRLELLGKERETPNQRHSNWILLNRFLNQPHHFIVLELFRKVIKQEEPTNEEGNDGPAHLADGTANDSLLHTERHTGGRFHGSSDTDQNLPQGKHDDVHHQAGVAISRQRIELVNQELLQVKISLDALQGANQEFFLPHRQGEDRCRHNSIADFLRLVGIFWIAVGDRVIVIALPKLNATASGNAGRQGGR